MALGKFYYCYSPNLMRYLERNGVHKVDEGVHRRTLKTFWVYEQTEDLSYLLARWTLKLN